MTVGSPGGQYDDPGGFEALRASIAQHCGVSRGLRAGPDDIVITSGTQQAVDLLVRTLCLPGDVVAMEDPGYPVVRALFASHRLDVRPIQVDAEGLVVDALPDEAKLVYVSPAHQFPIGAVMSARRRTALLGWALRRGAVVIEDDYDSEYRFTSSPLQPLHAVDSAGLVMYVGTFSKSLLPMLRLGFLIAPRNVLAAVRKAKFLTDWHCPTPPQATLAEFIDAGHLFGTSAPCARSTGSGATASGSASTPTSPGGSSRSHPRPACTSLRRCATFSATTGR